LTRSLVSSRPGATSRSRASAKFSVTDRAAREGRNPATGETIQIAPSRAAAALKAQLNS
jgi:nucleoid DNA-binding protein